MVNEKRLIEQIKEYFCESCNSYEGIKCRACWVDDVMGVIEDAPTVDAVEVVRCKVCQHSADDAWPKGKVWCRKICRYMKEDGFCSYGERSEINGLL